MAVPGCYACVVVAVPRAAVFATCPRQFVVPILVTVGQRVTRFTEIFHTSDLVPTSRSRGDVILRLTCCQNQWTIRASEGGNVGLRWCFGTCGLGSVRTPCIGSVAMLYSARNSHRRLQPGSVLTSFNSSFPPVTSVSWPRAGLQFLAAV